METSHYLVHYVLSTCLLFSCFVFWLGWEAAKHVAVFLNAVKIKSLLVLLLIS